MTELSFLLELFLNHKLPKATKTAITERIATIQTHTQAPMLSRQGIAATAPTGPIVTQVAQTPAAAEAVAARERAIQAAMSDKPEQGRTSPRKF